MRGCSAVAAFLLIIAAGLSFAAVAIPKWYEVSSSGTTEIGLFKTCAGGECEKNEYADMSTCSRKGSSMKTRTQAVAGLVIVSGIMGICACGAAVGAVMAPSSILSPVALLLCILSATTGGCGCALFVYNIENWYFCDKTYCEYFGFTNCTNKFSTAFYLAVVAVIAGLVGFICQLVAVILAPPAAAASVESEPNQSQAYASEEPYYEEQQPLPEGDWVYDDASGLYWSDKEQLYLDHAAGQYYDPASGQWYDPATQRWYVRD